MQRHAHTHTLFHVVVKFVDEEKMVEKKSIRLKACHVHNVILSPNWISHKFFELEFLSINIQTQLYDWFWCHRRKIQSTSNYDITIYRISKRDDSFRPSFCNSIQSYLFSKFYRSFFILVGYNVSTSLNVNLIANMTNGLKH